MSSYRITLLAGDGIGPEITAVARQLLEVVAQQHNFKHKITAIFLHHSTTDNYYMSSRRIES